MSNNTDLSNVSAVIKLKKPISTKQNEIILQVIVNTLKYNGFDSYIIDFMPRIFAGYKNSFILAGSDTVDCSSGSCLYVYDYDKGLNISMSAFNKEETNIVYIDILLFSSHLQNIAMLKKNLVNAFKEVANILGVDNISFKLEEFYSIKMPS